ncbi:hypothetical protein DESUT3_05100 [Desulfuromonas versatilis]|uniref:Rhodanese domain-containing protein n=1 Tax=Desulfuromonas versatilis TaxID=2802975 RepID=A0ABM8HR83_9BACT|nr:rhodanese-like domain-containing protein [Desulfuromonas versatilis]BCR03441.1 hypothetical protein DESUT3_05100 [Desulfuromonas versatilis]
MMKKWFGRAICGLVLALLCSGGAVSADSYNYLSPEAVRQNLESRVPMLLVDIQVEEEFAAHHLPGALATFAYPVKTEAEKARLDAVVEKLNASEEPVVIVCPRGGGGAERAYQHLQASGIPAGRLFILEKGQDGWPYPELTEKGK